MHRLSLAGNIPESEGRSQPVSSPLERDVCAVRVQGGMLPSFGTVAAAVDAANATAVPKVIAVHSQLSQRSKRALLIPLQVRPPDAAVRF